MPVTAPAAAVTLESLELRVLHLPLVSPFTTSFGTETVREVIVVRARTTDGEGWGEIVTQHEPYYSSEYTHGAWDVAQRFLMPALLEARTFAPEDVAGILEPVIGHRMVKGGLELAILDAALRAQGRPLGEYLGSVRDRVPSGVSVGIQRDPAAMVDAVGTYLDEGYVRIKIKIKPGRDVDDTAAVRDAFGAIPLQVDANSAYTLADIDTLAELDDERLAASVLVVAADVTEARHHLPGAEAPSVIELRQGGGFGRVVEVDPALAALVGACDGDLAVGPLVDAIADLLEVDAVALRADVLPRVRELLFTGFLAFA